jgi:hypothetical protein
MLVVILVTFHCRVDFPVLHNLGQDPNLRAATLLAMLRISYVEYSMQKFEE